VSSTSRLLATDLHTETVTSNDYNNPHEIFQSHFTSSQADLLYSSVVLVPLRLLPPLVPLLICSERLAFTWKLQTTNCLGQVKVKVTLRLTVSQSVSVGVEPHLGLMTRYLLLFVTYGLVFFFVGRPL
jgi:hypothetical protein